jgi:flagellar basal body-associated protein FliL
MAEIEIERRPRRSGWRWVLIALVIAILAAAAWYFFMGGAEVVDAPPAAENPAPTYEMDEPADAGPATVVPGDTMGAGDGVQVIPRPDSAGG